MELTEKGLANWELIYGKFFEAVEVAQNMSDDELLRIFNERKQIVKENSINLRTRSLIQRQ